MRILALLGFAVAGGGGDTTNMMKISHILCVLMQIGSMATRAQAPRHGNVPLPRFEDYPAAARPPKPPAMPIFKNDDDLEADIKLRQAVTFVALDGPNFAGKFTVAEISCGSGCLYIAVINEENGNVFSDMPFYSMLVGPFEDRLGRNQLGRVSYRLHSRLLVASGCFDATSGRDDGFCARMYYELKDDHFRLIRPVALDWQ